MASVYYGVTLLEWRQTSHSRSDAGWPWQGPKLFSHLKGTCTRVDHTECVDLLASSARSLTIIGRSQNTRKRGGKKCDCWAELSCCLSPVSIDDHRQLGLVDWSNSSSSNSSSSIEQFHSIFQSPSLSLSLPANFALCLSSFAFAFSLSHPHRVWLTVWSCLKSCSCDKYEFESTARVSESVCLCVCVCVH